MNNLPSTKLPPMNKEKAVVLIERMRSQTKNKDARIATLRLALGRHGNLGAEARDIYQRQLEAELS